VTSHFGLDLDGVEHLSVVNANHAANHLGDDDHVAKMCLHDSGLLVGGGFLLGLAELLDESKGLALETALEATTGTGVDEFNELLVSQIKELFELNSTVRECTEGTLLLNIGGRLGVGNFSHG